jgi:hypothetical protein
VDPLHGCCRAVVAVIGQQDGSVGASNLLKQSLAFNINIRLRFNIY